MSQVMEWLATGCALTLYAAVAALPLALLVLGIDATVGRWMAARFRCLLWTLVAMRLLMPVAPESALSLQNVWRLISSQGKAHDAHRLELTPGVPNGAAAPAAMVSEAVPNPFERIAQPDSAAAAINWTEAFIGILPMIWVFGLTVIFSRAIIASARFAWRLRTIPCIEDRVVIDMLLQVCDHVGAGRRPHVKYVTDLSAPALFGLFRPTLCLPEETRGQLSEKQLCMIMLHEVMHLRRRDGFLSWLLTVVQSAHWFNPIAWLAIRRIALFREQACDDAVRQFTAPTERRVYTDLLLRFAAGRPTANLGLVGLWFARPIHHFHHLTSRIEAFGHGAEHRRKIPRPTIAALVGLLAIVGLTDAVSSEAEDTPPRTISEWMAQDKLAPSENESLAQPTGEQEEGPVEARTYDISKALKKLAEINPDADPRKWLMTYTKLPSLQVRSIRIVDNNPDHLELVMAQRDHEFYAAFLESIARSGPWQVIVKTRILRATHIEAIGDVNWQDAVKFALPTAKETLRWPDRVATDETQNGGDMSLSVESVSWEYAPYLACVIEDEKMRRVLDRFQGDRRFSLLSIPTVTVFSGQRATLRDESFRPFVVGVHFVKGELATAAQPDIAVLSEGTNVDVQPCVVDAGALDLQCRLTVSKIDSVSETKLPGQEITVQNPHVSRRTISARCRVAPGETLLIAPMTDASTNDKGEVFFYAITAEWFPDSFGVADDRQDAAPPKATENSSGGRNQL